MYIHICIYVCMCIHIYIYIERERERYRWGCAGLPGAGRTTRTRALERPTKIIR